MPEISDCEYYQDIKEILIAIGVIAAAIILIAFIIVEDVYTEWDQEVAVERQSLRPIRPGVYFIIEYHEQYTTARYAYTTSDGSTKRASICPDDKGVSIHEGSSLEPEALIYVVRGRTPTLHILRKRTEATEFHIPTGTGWF